MPRPKQTTPSFSGAAEAGAALPLQETPAFYSDRLLGIVAGLLCCRIVLLLFNSNGVSRLVSAHGVSGSKLVSYRWSYEGAPYLPTERFLLPDATGRPELMSAFGYLNLERIGFFFRTPIQVASTHTLTMIALDPKPAPAPTEQTLAYVDEIVALLDQEFRDLSPLMADPKAGVTLPLSLDDLHTKISADVEPAFILDSELQVVHANAAASDLLRLPKHKIINANAADFMTATNDGIMYFLKRALSERVSTPGCEIIVERGARKRRVYWLIASPFSPMANDSYFLLVNVREQTSQSLRYDEIEKRVFHKETAAPLASPTIDFLLETLPRRQTLRNRNSMSYVTLRSWRQPVREYQLKALKALKLHCPGELAGHIADEIVGGVTSLVGRTAFKAVVPVPCGHSKSTSCLSVEIARAVGNRLQLPVVHAFDEQRLSGSSHPRKNATRPPLILVNPPDGPVILVDDVATSGTQLERAVNILRPICGAVLPIAWIGGDAAKD